MSDHNDANFAWQNISCQKSIERKYINVCWVACGNLTILRVSGPDRLRENAEFRLIGLDVIQSPV